MTIVDRLVHLVSTPSVSHHEAAVADDIEALAARVRPSVDCRRLGNNLVVGPTERQGRPLIALVGHIDTVPPQGNEAASIDDGAVWGIGSVDMKAGIAVMCDLLETLPAELGVDVVWIFYDCEEVSYDDNGLGKVLDAFPTLKTIDFAFVVEPTDLALELGCNGHVNVEVTFHGTSAHSARNWLGDNAVTKAAPFLTRVAEIPTREHRVGEATYREVISVTTASGGIARNVVPDSFVLNVNHRFPPGRAVDDAAGYVMGLVPDGATARVVDSASAGGVPEANAVLEAFTAQFTLRVAGKQGWTDVARLTEFGVDAVNFGPGDPTLCHRRDEHCPIDQLETARRMLFEFLTTHGAGGVS